MPSCLTSSHHHIMFARLSSLLGWLPDLMHVQCTCTMCVQIPDGRKFPTCMKYIYYIITVYCDPQNNTSTNSAHNFHLTAVPGITRTTLSSLWFVLPHDIEWSWTLKSEKLIAPENRHFTLSPPSYSSNMYYDPEKNAMFDIETGALIPLAEGNSLCCDYYE